MRLSLLVTVLGLTGLLSLLFAGHLFPETAAILQGGALVWFLLFGIVRTIFDRKHWRIDRLNRRNRQSPRAGDP
jgi:hypothetical protein